MSEIYGASLAPLMHPCHPHVIAFATGPFIVIWDWKADRKQVRACARLVRLSTHLKTDHLRLSASCCGSTAWQ